MSCSPQYSEDIQPGEGVATGDARTEVTDIDLNGKWQYNYGKDIKLGNGIFHPELFKILNLSFSGSNFTMNGYTFIAGLAKYSANGTFTTLTTTIASKKYSIMKMSYVNRNGRPSPGKSIRYYRFSSDKKTLYLSFEYIKDTTPTGYATIVKQDLMTFTRP